MTPAGQRKFLRWLHMLASLPIVGYIYGPLAHKEHPAFIVESILFPLVVFSGLWMWKGHVVKRWIRK